MKQTLKYALTLFAFFLLRGVLFSQNQIIGKVVNDKAEAVAFANILLFKAVDSSFVKGQIAQDDGTYTFDNVAAGTYWLDINRVGLDKKRTAIFTLTPSVGRKEMPVTTLGEAAQLKEIEVVTKRPFLEQQIDRTIVNVANSIIGSGSTALEVLSKAPGITVDYQAELIQLRGKEGVIIQIDGKPSYLSGQDVLAMLRSMPSDNIEKIEIITNPSVKYDASGNSGIINIVFKKDNSLGTKGSFSIAVGSGVHDRERSSLQVSHRTKKWLLFGNYSFNRAGNFFDFDLYREQPDGSLRNYISQQTHLPMRDLGHTTKLGANYDINKNTSIGAMWTGFWNKQTQDGFASLSARRGETMPIYLQVETHRTQTQKPNNQIVNLNFQHKFTENKGQLSADLDVVLFKRLFNNVLDTKVLILTNGSTPPVAGLSNTSEINIGVTTFKTDYSTALSKTWNMETGAKYASVNSDNDVKTSSGEIGTLVLDSTLSSHFTYKEQVYAAYNSVVGKVQDMEIKLGLRTEYTIAESNSTTYKQPKISRYWNWFPSLFVSKPITDKQSLIFSYSHRIDRPNYQDLNPARGYVDLYGYSEGNIDLNRNTPML